MDSTWPATLPVVIINQAGTDGWALRIDEALCAVAGLAPENVIDLTELGMPGMQKVGDAKVTLLALVRPTCVPEMEHARILEACPNADLVMVAAGKPTDAGLNGWIDHNRAVRYAVNQGHLSVEVIEALIDLRPVTRFKSSYIPVGVHRLLRGLRRSSIGHVDAGPILTP